MNGQRISSRLCWSLCLSVLLGHALATAANYGALLRESRLAYPQPPGLGSPAGQNLNSLGEVACLHSGPRGCASLTELRLVGECLHPMQDADGFTGHEPPIGTASSDQEWSPVARRRVLLLITLLGLVLWSNLVRYMDPIGEKHFPLLAPGAADFSVIFDGTRVFLDGNNPYYFRDANSMDRWDRGDIIGGRWFRVSYQPSHFLVYIPIALVTTDNRVAGRIVFAGSLALYLLLAVLTWRLVLRGVAPVGQDQRYLSLLLLAVFMVLLAANIGSALSLARCQSDIINATACWAAVLLFLRGRRFWPMFLLISAAAMKGYPALLGIGLFFLGLRRGGWRGEVLGVVAGVLLWLVPVLPYLHDGFIAAVSHAVGFFDPIWFNHSFANVFFHLSPGWVAPGRGAMVLLGIGVCAGCWWQARGALGREDGAAATWWLCMFATASLTAMVGLSTLSYIYNQILILPGVLVFLSCGDLVWQGCGFSRSTTRWLWTTECVMAVFLWKYSLPGMAMPLAGVGNVLLILLLAIGVAGHLRLRWARSGAATSPAIVSDGRESR